MLFSFIAYQGVCLWRAGAKKSGDPNYPLLQALFLFQSMTLFFRGWQRSTEWIFLAFYSAAAVLALHPRRGGGSPERAGEPEPYPGAMLQGIEGTPERDAGEESHLEVTSPERTR